MRVLLSRYGSRGDVALMVGLAVRPPVIHGTTPPAAADLSPHAAELVAACFDTVGAAEECDAPTGVWR